MSRYSYAGTYRNPTEGFFVKEEADGLFYIYVRDDRAADGSAAPDSKHTMHTRARSPVPGFEEHSEASECITQLAEAADEDYERYREENHFEIAQMERYEAFMQEY